MQNKEQESGETLMAPLWQIRSGVLGTMPGSLEEAEETAKGTARKDLHCISQLHVPAS